MANTISTAGTDQSSRLQATSQIRWKSEPSQRELLLLCSVTCLLFVSCILLFRNYFDLVDNFADSAAYMGLAYAIRHWDFHGVVIKQFWGLPYAMAALSSLTGLSERASLLLISALSSFAAVLVAYRLWGGWIAGFFAVLNFDWLQRSYLGGSEPLFALLLFAAFLATRKERWLLAALLASLATVVRPLGILALLAVGILILWKRNYRTFLLATAIGITVAVLYVVPVARHFGDPLANVHSYHNQAWAGGRLFGLPFYAIIKGTILEPAPWTNLVHSFGWILLVLVAMIAMVRTRRFAAYARSHLVEMIFLIPYLWTLYTYNYPHWARSNFARFAIPIIPFVLLALDRWIPKDKRILWGLGLVSPILAACSALGIINVFHRVFG
jgi:hypothetical protein